MWRSTASAGRPNSRACANGMSRSWKSIGKMPQPGAPTSCSLEQIAGGYASREQFLTELTLGSPGRDQRPRPTRRYWTKTM